MSMRFDEVVKTAMGSGYSRHIVGSLGEPLQWGNDWEATGRREIVECEACKLLRPRLSQYGKGSVCIGCLGVINLEWSGSRMAHVPTGEAIYFSLYYNHDMVFPIFKNNYVSR